MALMYDKNVFCQRLIDLRKKRWEQYKSNQDKRINPYMKFADCKSQETLAAALDVERRTYGKWEAGTTIPTIDKVADICNVLDCNIDYLLGAEELVGFSPSAIASHYSKISIDIIDKAKNDCEYRDFLNYFMHPEHCYALVNSTNLNSWRDYLSQDEAENLADPLKALITDIFDSYQAFTPITQYKRDSLRKYIVLSLPQEKISFTAKKLDKCICIGTCLPNSKIKELGISAENPQSYQLLINYLVDYCFNVLATKEIIYIQKEKLGHLFVHMLEKYLEE